MSNRFEKIAKNAVFEALDLCVECKGCKAECPSGVDMGKLKLEFLHNYYKSERRPLSDYFFAYIGEFSRIMRPLSGIANFFINNDIVRIIRLMVNQS